MRTLRYHSIQYWQLKKTTDELKQTQHMETCLDAWTNDKIQLGDCHGQKGNQKWRMSKVITGQDECYLVPGNLAIYSLGRELRYI